MIASPSGTTLFVCHEGQRTGAPLVLLWLIRWLVAHTTIRPVVALMRDGPLRQEFEALCPTHTFTRPVAEPWTRRLRRRIDPIHRSSDHVNRFAGCGLVELVKEIPEWRGEQARPALLQP